MKEKKNKTTEKKKKTSKKTSKSDALKNQIEELKQEVDNLKSESEKSKEKNIRLLAEFDNYRRRSVNERQNLSKYSAEAFVKDLLPVLDDFDRTMESVKEDNPVLEGVQMIKTKLDKILEDHGIDNFNSIGEEFDPNLHEALMNQETDDKKDGIILNEFEKGYKYHDKILRHAKVVVSKAKQEA